MPENKRSLYMCQNALTDETMIYCSKGHILNSDGDVNIRRLLRGDPLEFGVCQQCPDFDYMGEAIPKGERGWLNNEK